LNIAAAGDDKYNFIIAIAERKLNTEEISNWFTQHTVMFNDYMNKKIAIIGGGNLGTAIAEGLISSGFIHPDHIIIQKEILQH